MTDVTSSVDATSTSNQTVTESLLTTFDNPFDPFDEFKAWYSWDISAGYHTLSLLARIINTSYELSEADELLAHEQAVDEIVRENVSGMHRKVTRQVQVVS
jgi:hypothetical protein